MTSKLKALAKEQKQLFADLHLSRLQKLVRATDTANNMAKQFTKGKNARDINTAIELATTAAEAEKALKSYLLLLSPAEIPHVQAVFDSMDLNHDSVYSVFEIHTGLTRLGIQVDVNQMAGVFAIAAEKGNFDVDDIDDKGDFRMDAKGFFDIYWAALELELRSLNELADLLGVEAHLGHRVATRRKRLLGLRSRLKRVFELVRGMWVFMRRPPDLVSGLPLIGTLDILGINAWHKAVRI
jgi:hypothetical protein